MPTVPTLQRAAHGARILEAITNYARVEIEESRNDTLNLNVHFSADEYFWPNVFGLRTPFGSNVDVPNEVIVSEWVARVPGLFWMAGAQAHRREGEKLVEYRDGNSITLRPMGKSSLVSGGVGTIKLPPSEAGYRLITLTSSANVSAGVPALVSPEVWEHCRLREGSVVRIYKATWQAMARGWSAEFPSTRGIPRAYIRIDGPDTVEVIDDGAAAAIHPFSIMRYFDGKAELFDFVFATGYSTDPRMRQEISGFFDDYCRAEGREGEYLIDADVAQPMWASRYHSPAELRVAEELLNRRIEDAMLGHNVTEVLQGVLSGLSHGELRRISSEIGIPPATWFRGDAAVHEAQRFILCVPPAKIAVLIDAIRTLQPDLIPTEGM
ncbi:MAG TPA: hypothetical protein VF883_04550 [Thermoanaerobaculia bacterium]|jgi:hypothetical protein